MTTEVNEGLTLLGYRSSGQPIYLIRGAAPDPADDDGDGDDTDPPDDDSGGGKDGKGKDDGKGGKDDDADDGKDDDSKLGQSGEKVLAELRAKARRDDRAKAKQAARIAELETQLKGKKPEDKPKDDAPDPEELRKQARAEAKAEVARDRALDKVEVLAAKAGFAEPEDARLFLADQADDFLDGGKVDAEAIKDALTELSTKRPYLLAGKHKRFQGSVDQGPRGGGDKTLDQKIAEARKNGQTQVAIALEMQKLTTAATK
jgi:hypothetical protein